MTRSHYAGGAIDAALHLGLTKVADDWDLKDYLTGGAAAAAGGALGYKSLRRFRPSGDATLRALQEASKDLPFEISTHIPMKTPKDRAIRRFMFGAPDISEATRDAAQARDVLQRPGVVLHHGNPWGVQAVQGKVNINDVREKLTPAFGDKGSFAELMGQIQHKLPKGTQAIPQTEHLRDALRSFDHKPELLHKHLSAKHPGGFLVKPTDESLGDVKSFINEGTPFTDKRWRHALENPTNFIVQEKIPLKNEYRVHTMQGVPFTATHRRAPEGKFREKWDALSKHLGIGTGGFAHIPVNTDMKGKLHDYVSTVNKPLQELYQKAPLHQAFDVGELADGSFRLIESNTTPGTLMSPTVSRKLQEMVTGRRHKDYATAGAAGMAVGTGLTGSEISSRLREKEPKHTRK